MLSFAGLEQVPIPVINGFNNEMLDFCNYSAKRVPMEGVNLNLNEEFLCGCDCDDDCVVCFIYNFFDKDCTITVAG